MVVDDARLTGKLLAHTDDVDELRAHPDVADVKVLPGRGDVVSIVPRPGVSAVDLANGLRDRAGVTWAHPDLELNIVPLTIPDDPLLGNQWHLLNDGQRGYVPGVDINAEEAWAITAGAGTRIGVLDSGTDVDHPDLVVIEGRDYVDDDDRSDPENGNNHGTAAAGLAAATGNNGIGVAGVAYESEVYGIRILVGGGQLGGATSEEIYQAFVEAVDNGADVINNSWGAGDRLSCGNYPLVGALLDAFDYAETEGRGGLGHEQRRVGDEARVEGHEETGDEGAPLAGRIPGESKGEGGERRAHHRVEHGRGELAGPEDGVGCAEQPGVADGVVAPGAAGLAHVTEAGGDAPGPDVVVVPVPDRLACPGDGRVEPRQQRDAEDARSGEPEVHT